MKNLKIYITILFCSLVNLVAAQVLSTTPVSGVSRKFNFNFNLGASAPADDVYPTHINNFLVTGSAYSPSTTNPATTTFLEFGDGNFTREQSLEHTYPPSGATYGVMAKLTGLYDNDPKPPRVRPSARPAGIATALNSASNAKLAMSPILTSSKSVGISSNVNSIVANDTMIFVVTYKGTIEKNNPIEKPAYILFSYNNVQAFREILAATEDFSQGGIVVPKIRPHFGETKSIVDASVSGYDNCIKIDSLLLDNLEHHIFITLVPKETLPTASPKGEGSKGDAEDAGNTADIEVGLYNRAGALLDTDVENLPLMLDSHDPNYVEIFPKCLPMPKKVDELKFHVRCQNIGLGGAREVKMKVGLPSGLNTSDIIRSSTRDQAPYGIRGAWDFDTEPDSLIVIFDLTSLPPIPSGSTPTPATAVTLSGIENNPNYMNDRNTMADIWFTIKTNPRVPNIMASAASIYFTNLSGSINPAVRTEMDFAQYSNCCNCNTKEEKNCDKNKKRSKFWRWLFCKKC